MKWVIYLALFCMSSLSYGQSQPCSIVTTKEQSNEKVIAELVDSCYSGEIRFTDIMTLKPDTKYDIKYVTGELRDELPEVIYKSFVVFFSGDKAFILDLSFVEILHKEDSGGFYLGGIYQYRGIGHYYVYHVEKGKVNLLFTSDEPVFNNALGCSSFKTGKLQSFFKDVNHDGFKDLSFKGIKLIYCADAQLDRVDDQIVREEDVSIAYLFHPIEKRFKRYKP